MAESAIIIIAPWMEIKRYKEMYVYYTVYTVHIYIYISQINSASGFSHFAVFFFAPPCHEGICQEIFRFFPWNTQHLLLSQSHVHLENASVSGGIPL